MALKIIEGLDRTGKSSVAKFYQDQGYELVHMSAPAKGTSAPAYLGEMVDMLMSFNGRNVVLDRSHYGELIWPEVYKRDPLLTDEDIEALREIEESLEVERILMHDPNVEAHWSRCVANNEPLTKQQFVKARTLFSSMADKYGFTRKTLNDFPEAAAIASQVQRSSVQDTQPVHGGDAGAKSVTAPTLEIANKTPQQLKLEKANAINEILAKRIIKGKGQIFDDLERSVRSFLNNELGKIFGSNTTTATGFTDDEVELLKFFCKRLNEKETQ